MKVGRWSSGLRLATLGWVVLVVLLSPWLSLSVAPSVAVAASAPTQLTGGHWGYISRNELVYFDKNGNQAYDLTHDNLNSNSFSYNLDKPSGGLCYLSAKSQFNPSDDASNYDSQNYERTFATNSGGLDKIDVTYGVPSGPPKNHCDHTTYTSTVGNLDNWNITYYFKDRQDILQVNQESSRLYVDAKKTVKFTDPNNKKITGTWEVYLNPNQSNNTCQDFMLVQTPRQSDHIDGYFEELSDKNTSRGSAYPDHKQVEGCWIVKGDSGVHSASIIIGGWNEAKDNGTGTGAGGGSTDQSTQNECQVSGGFGWILCPFIDLALNVLYGGSSQGEVKNPSGGLVGAVMSQLDFGNLNDQYIGARAVWGAFRGLANVLFIVIFLVIIFSNTLSIGLSNYDIKKMLPRLVFAAVLVQFSWVLMQLAIDVTNIVAAGIGTLIHAAVASVHTNPSGVVQDLSTGLGTVAIGIIAAALAIVFIFPLLMALFALILSLIAIFITLEFRKVLILILVVLSPIAFVAWILPGTENLFKTWWKMLSRALLMYPMIVLIFAAAAMVGSITAGNGSGNGNWQGLIAASLPIAAFFAIPWTFKWAGSALGFASGFFAGTASTIGSRAKHSQFAKDAALRRRERGAVRATEGGNRLTRGFGRVQSGTFLPGRMSRRRLAAAYTAAQDARSKDYQADFRRRNLSSAQLQHEAMNHRESAGRVAAISMLAERSAINELTTVRNHMGGDAMNAANERIWRAGLGSHWGDIHSKAPQLTQGVSNGAFTGVTGDRLAGYHSATVGAMMAHAATPAGAADIRGILRALEHIEASPALRSRMDTGGLSHVANNAAVFAGTPTAGGVDGEAWVGANVTQTTPYVDVDHPGTASFN